MEVSALNGILLMLLPSWDRVFDVVWQVVTLPPKLSAWPTKWQQEPLVSNKLAVWHAPFVLSISRVLFI